MNNLKKRVICIILALVMMAPFFGGNLSVNGDKPKIQGQTIGADSGSTAVIKSDGSLWVWGKYHFGPSGNNVIGAGAFPMKVMDQAVSVSAESNMAVIKSDGSLWTWGRNDEGQLGDGTNISSNKPKKIMDKVTAVSVGGFYMAAIKSDGSLWTWGSNHYGQLGNGKADSSPIAGIKPAKIMDKVIAVSAGEDHTAAIKADGSLWTWGQNWAGQLGDNLAESRYKPKKVMDGVAAVSVSFGFTAAIKTDGSLWTWGNNRSGQLGDGTTTKRYKPVKIMDDVVAVSTTLAYVAAIKKDGSLWTWGDNDYGQLGDGTNIGRSKPVKVMEDVAAVSTDFSYFVAVKTDGTLWMSGSNEINPYVNSPIKVFENASLGSSAVKKAPLGTSKENIKVSLNNKHIPFAQSSIIKDGQVLVPAKELFASMGATYKWNQAAQAITATKGDVSILMQPGYNYISRNGKLSILGTLPQTISGVNYVPIKAVADAFSTYYYWDESNKIITLETLDTKLIAPYVKYEEKMKIYGFDRLYDNQRAKTNEPVTKAEALKLAIAAVFNTYDISGFAAPTNEYTNSIWVKYARDSGITLEDINSSNFDQKAKYIDVITYFENCKTKFLKEQPVKTAELKLKDISEYTPEQQSAIKDMAADSVIQLLSDSLNGNKNIFKGQLNELVVNFVERYGTIAPTGETLVTDPKKLPSNADKYPYILASVDKRDYETPFMTNYKDEKWSPKGLYASQKDYYSHIKFRSEEYFDSILNIDYRTITEESFKEKISQYMIFAPRDANIKYYVKHVKDNEIILEGSTQMLLPILYYDGSSYRARLRIKFEVKHAKTKENLLYLDMLDTDSKIYNKKSYDMLVDCVVSQAIGNNNKYMDHNQFYRFIVDKENCGITDTAEK